VTESKWSRIFGIRNEVLGLLFFTGMLFSMIYALPPLTPVTTLYLYQLLAAAGALLVSLLLVLIQFFILRDYCFYCLISAGITVLLFVNTLLLFVGSHLR